MNNNCRDVRDVFFSELFNILKNDKDAILLTADTGAMAFEKYRRELPNQFFNVGIAEQNMIGVAAGLALSGKKVFIYGISNFVALRCFEQIRVDLCAMKLPVTIIGMGTGYMYSADGPTHHVTEDLAAMRALPYINIWNISDCEMAQNIINLAYKTPLPTYVRLDKGPFLNIYNNKKTNFNDGLQVLKPTKDLTVIATGIMVSQTLQVITELEKDGMEIGLIDLFRIKPINESRFLECLNGVKTVITVEEHNVVGGLGSAVSEILMQNNILIPMKIIGIKNVYRCEVGTREYLREFDGIHLDGIKKIITKHYV